MSTKLVIFFFSFVMINGCNDKGQIMNSQDYFDVNTAFYTEWVAGARGAGSSIDITIELLKKESNYQNKDVSVIGLYFKNNYVLLNEGKQNVYRGSLKNTLNKEVIDEPIYGSEKNESANSENSVPLNIQLMSNEGLLHIKASEKDYYFKIKLEKRALQDVPM